MSPRISIVVAHLNQPDLLRLLLDTLAAQRSGTGAIGMDEAEVIVVDNGSRALPEDVVADFPFARLITEAVPGPGPARNRGIAAARADLLAFIDSDCQATPDWIAVILARFDADPGLQIIGGEIAMNVEVPGRPTPAEAFECVYAYNQRDYIERQGFSVTANLAMRRAAYAAVGPFAGLEIAEDMDWCWRAAAKGYRIVYVPEMLISHPARRTMRELYAKWDRQVTHHYQARVKSPADRLKWMATALVMMVSGPAALPQILKSPRLSSPRERLQAFLGATRLRAYRSRRMMAAPFSSRARAGSLQTWRNQE
jgi:GT2 family glycosyltransferase